MMLWKENKRWAWVVGLAIAVGWMAADMNRYVHRMPKMNGSLNRWLPLIPIMNHGPELYVQRADYLYPPIFLILIKPLGDLEWPIRAMVYELLKQASLWLGIFLGWKILVGSFGKAPIAVLIAGILLTGRYFESDLSHGNVNIFLFLLVMLGCRLWQKEYAFAAGIPLALAVAVKVTPALILAYAAYKRQWRLLLGASLGLFLFLFLLPALYLGWHENLGLFTGWYHHVIVPFSTKLDIYTIHLNQSLAGTLLRYLTSAIAMDKPTVRYINLAHLTNAQVLMIYKTCAAALLLFAFVGLRGKIDDKYRPRFVLHLSVLFPLMVLLSGYSWHAHFVYLFIPYLALATAWTRLAPGPKKKWLGIGLAASFILGTVMTAGIHPFLSDLFDSYGALTLAALLVLVMTVLVSRKAEEIVLSAQCSVLGAEDKALSTQH